jgi:hypothetical protein
MLTTDERPDDARRDRPTWSAPRLQRLEGQRSVAAGISGDFDGEASETGFS